MDTENAKSFEYQALVVSSCSSEHQESETDLVLILKSLKDQKEVRSRIYGVAKAAFLPPSSIEPTFDNIEDAKNLERRCAIPLKFGDIIQFNREDVNHDLKTVHRFYREKPIYEVSSNENGPLLKIGGVIEPNKPTTFWTPLESVAIPTQEATRAEPDVYLYAWIRVDTRMASSRDPYNLELSFDSFESCDATEQGRVCEAPWHRYSLESKFTTWRAEPTPCDSDDEIDLEPRKDIYVVENKWAERIHRQLGLFVGERLILCKDLPQYDFIIPLLRPISCVNDTKTFLYPSVGEYFHFSAVWSVHHNAFLVNELLPLQVLRAHTTSVSGNLLVRVNPAELMSGFFTDSEKSLGLIDDPYHSLCFLELHPIAHSVLKVMAEVRAVRAAENRSVRYRIVRTVLEDDHTKRLNEWLQTSEFCLGPLNGMVINRDTVITAKYPNIFFRLDTKENIPPGTGVRFRGKRAPGVNSEVRIIEYHINSEFSARKVIGTEDNRIFQVSLKSLQTQEQLAYSDIVGPVDMRLLKPPTDTGSGNYLGWIRESVHIGDARRSCTIMEIFSLSLCPPMLPVHAYSSRTSSRASRVTPRGSSTGGSTGSRSSVYSIANNRFVGPGTRKLSQINAAAKDSAA